MLKKPEVPMQRGAVTISDVASAEDVESYCRAVESWAQSAWDAYSPLQPITREWVHAAIAQPASRR